MCCLRAGVGPWLLQAHIWRAANHKWVQVHTSTVRLRVLRLIASSPGLEIPPFPFLSFPFLSFPSRLHGLPHGLPHGVPSSYRLLGGVCADIINWSSLLASASFPGSWGARGSLPSMDPGAQLGGKFSSLLTAGHRFRTIHGLSNSCKHSCFSWHARWYISH